MSLLRAVLAVNSGTAVCAVLGIAQTILISRGLGPEGVGQYALAVSVLSLGATICAFGIPVSFLYHARKEPDQRNAHFTNAFWILAVIGIGSGVVAALMMTRCSAYFGAYGAWASCAIALYMPLALERLLFRNFLLTDLSCGWLATIEIGAATGALLLIGAAWGLSFLTVDLALGAFVLATAIRTGLGLLFIRNYIRFSNPPTIHNMKRLAVMGRRQLWPDLVLMLNEQIGILLLKHLSEDFGEVGYFSRAASVAQLLTLASQAVMPVLFSRWAGLRPEDVRSHAEKVLRFATTFSLLLSVMIMLGAEWIVILLYGKGFLPAVVPMRILSAGTACALISRTLLQLLGGRGIPEKGSYVMVIGTLITALASIVLIPAWGMMGCAVANAGGQLLILALLVCLGIRTYQLSLKDCTIIKRRDLFLLLNGRVRMGN